MHSSDIKFIVSEAKDTEGAPILVVEAVCPYCEEITSGYTYVQFADGTPGGKLEFINRCEHWHGWKEGIFSFSDNLRNYMFVYATSTGEYSGYYGLEATNDQEALDKFRHYHRHQEILVVFRSEQPFVEVL